MRFKVTQFKNVIVNYRLIFTALQLDEETIKDCQFLCLDTQRLLIQYNEYKIYQKYANDSYYVKFPTLNCLEFCSNILLIEDNMPASDSSFDGEIVFPYLTIEKPDLIPPPPTPPMRSEVDNYQPEVTDWGKVNNDHQQSEEFEAKNEDNRNFKQKFAEKAIQGVLSFISFARSLGLDNGNNHQNDLISNDDNFNTTIYGPENTWRGL